MKEVVKFVVIVAVLVKVSLMVIEGNDRVLNFVNKAIGHSKMTDGDTVYIQGVGHFNYSSLLEAKKIVEETYGVPTKIVQPIVITSDYYINGMVNASKCLDDFDNDKNKVLITSEMCYEEGVTEVGGLGEMNGNIVIVRSSSKGYKVNLTQVILHEIGHNQGFEHCDDVNCVMNVDGLNYTSTELCEKCRKK
jgi:hypothetical protein